MKSIFIIVFVFLFHVEHALADESFSDLAYSAANSSLEKIKNKNIKIIITDRKKSTFHEEYFCNLNNVLCNILASGNYFSSGRYDLAAKKIKEINLEKLKHSVPSYFYDEWLKTFNSLNLENISNIPKLKTYQPNNELSINYSNQEKQKGYIRPSIPITAGRETVSIIIDTGMPLSIITKNSADKLKAEYIKEAYLQINSNYSNGNKNYCLAIIKELHVGKITIKNFPVWVGGNDNALGLNFISLFNQVEFDSDKIIINRSNYSLRKKIIDVKNYSDISGIVNKKIAILDQDGKYQFAQIDTGMPYFMISSQETKNCNLSFIYNGGDHTKNWNYITCIKPTKIKIYGGKTIEKVMRIMDFPYHIFPNYIGAGILDNFNLIIDNQSGISGFYEKPNESIRKNAS